MRHWPILAILAALPAPALAQNDRPPTIVVTGVGNVETPPDIATLSFDVRGEGVTADEATAAMAARQKAVLKGLRSLDHGLEVRTGEVTIAEARGGNCSDYSDRDTKMSTGACAVAGRVARIETTIILSSVKDAGTAIGLAGRLGASNAEIQSFGLRDESGAARRAVAEATTQARVRAQSIADAAGTKLGPVISVTDSYNSINRSSSTVVDAISAQDIGSLPAPIVVDVSPKPVKTSVQLTFTFAIER
jgi:uncharacterized protein YggE